LCPSSRRAALLVVVLWTVAILTIMLGNLAFLTRTHLRLASNYSETSRLHNIAAAGIERAKVELLADEDPLDSLTETWANDETAFANYEIGGGTFSLLRSNPDIEGDPYLYGLEDEAGKLNLHTATREMLEALEGMNENRVDALLDWQDSDSNPTGSNGAENDYYSALPKPYSCKNAPLTSLDELLLVRGFTPALFYGSNRGLSPTPAAASSTSSPSSLSAANTPGGTGNSGSSSLPDQETLPPQGLQRWVTIYSSEPNTSQDGKPRVNIASADEDQLTSGISGLKQDEAQAIVAYRKQKPFKNLGDLLLVPATLPQSASSPDTGNKGQNGGKNPPPPPPENAGKPGKDTPPPPPPDGGGKQDSGKQPRPGNRNTADSAPADGSSGARKFSAQRLGEIIDYCTITDKKVIEGRININTAPVEVLAALPGMDKNTAQAIVDRREETSQPFAHIAELLDLPEISQETFIALSNLLTVRSHQFRAQSEARIEGVKATRTVIAILERNNGKVQPLYWHEY
jgi:type II secretory pathway component PulK